MKLLTNSLVALLDGASTGPIDIVPITEGLTPPVEVAQELGGGPVISSMRDQLQIGIAKDRIQVMDLSGKQENFERTAEFMVRIRKQIGGVCRALGINFEFERDISQPSGNYIAQRFVQIERFPQPNNLEATSVKLRMPASDGITYIFNIDSRLQKPERPQLFINWNTDIRPPASELSIFESGNEQEIQTLIEKCYKTTEELLDKLCV